MLAKLCVASHVDFANTGLVLAVLLQVNCLGQVALVGFTKQCGQVMTSAVQHYMPF